jgi:choline-sulfatase
VAITLLLLVAAGSGYRWWSSRAPVAGPGGGPRDSVLLVTLDTTRADRLGSYGHARARTRHLDRLAAEGVRFAAAFSPAPVTLPAHASLFTGLYPFEHGVRNNGNFYVSDRFDTITTVLAAQGYRTAAFVSAFVLDRRYGLARGFELYDDRMQGVQRQVVSLEAERRGDRTSEAMTAWLAQYAAGSLDDPVSGGAGFAAPRSPASRPPFFVWLHLYDPHEPYRPPPPFRDAFLDSPYDGEIAFDDAVVASVVDRLGQLGLLDTTIVAVIGDHGESLGDHGEETHSMFVYESALHVPFILWRPGRLPSGRVVSEPVRMTDVAPTLLDLVGAPPLPTPHGRSLVPLIQGGSGGEPPPIYAETYLPHFYMNWSPLRALRDGRWKLIDAPRPELYDLSRDAGESRNLYAEHPRTADAMRAALSSLTGGSEGSMAAGRLDREALEKLAALGYVAAAVEPAAREPGRDQPDPKDFIAVFNRLRRANTAVRDRRFAEALPVLQDVLRQDPRNAFARMVLGSTHMGMEQYREAIAEYAAYLTLVPASAYAHQWMAICYTRLGERDRAMEEAAAALAIDPKFSDALVLRGGILAALGRYDASVRDLRAAVENDPAKPMVRLDLAKVLDEAGRRDEARAEYEAILERQPDYAAALTGLGALSAQAGDLDRAVALLRRSLEVEPVQDGARLNLAVVLERQGHTAEAVAEYERLVRSREASPALRARARERLAALSR